MSMRSRITLLLLATALGCRSQTADLGMSDSAFVQVMGELKFVADEPNISDPVRAQRRDAILRKRQVTAVQLEKLGATLTAHPTHARSLWNRIDLKAQSLGKPPK